MNSCTFLIKASISSVKERHVFIYLPYFFQGKKVQIKILYSNISICRLQLNFELLEEKNRWWRVKYNLPYFVKCLLNVEKICIFVETEIMIICFCFYSEDVNCFPPAARLALNIKAAACT